MAPGSRASPRDINASGTPAKLARSLLAFVVCHERTAHFMRSGAVHICETWVVCAPTLRPPNASNCVTELFFEHYLNDNGRSITGGIHLAVNARIRARVWWNLNPLLANVDILARSSFVWKNEIVRG